MGYCEPADLYSFGLPRGVVSNPGRLAGSAASVTSSIVLDAHGFASGDPVSFRAEAGGALPAPLVSGTTYYAVPVSEHEFRVASSAGGTALSFSTSGNRVVVVAPLPISPAIEWASRRIDESLPAHVVPLEKPYPEVVVMTCAELAAGKLLSMTGKASKSLTLMVDDARKVLARWAKGVPVRGSAVETRANKAVSASAGYTDSFGWRGWGRW